MFGPGLIGNVREAYRFLVFNYDPGDEIYVFGFSRGAFSARTFIGFIRHVGPLHRLHVGRIDEAIELYRDRLEGKDGSAEAMRRFRSMYSDKVRSEEHTSELQSLMRISYAVFCLKKKKKKN